MAIRSGPKQQSFHEASEERRREIAFDQYDSICDAHGILPKELPKLDDATLTAWAREQLPPAAKGTDIPIKLLRMLVNEYVAACSQ